MATLLALSFLGLYVAPVMATCEQAFVRIYEEVAQDGEWKQFCSPNGSTNLVNVAHTDPGICAAVLKFDDNWNDCVNSAWYNEGTLNTAVCLWNNANWGGNGVKFTSDNVGSWGFGIFSDSFSSVEWGNACDS